MYEVVTTINEAGVAFDRAREMAPENAEARAPERPSLLKDLLNLVTKISFVILVFVLLFTFIFGISRYQDPAMAPAIKDGDLVVYHRYTKAGYQPRDPIVLEVGGQTQVRRVVAVEGDMVDINEDGLLINGALQQEREIYEKTERYVEGVDFPLVVPVGEVFVLGDSRVGSQDSRIYGCVKIEDTKGKVMTVIRRRGI